MKPKQVDAEVTGCTMPTKQGDACGKPGRAGLPAGVCDEHAVQIYRAVAALIEAEAGR